MTTATLINRMSQNLKCEVGAATAQIDLEGYTVDGKVIRDEDGFYNILFYRSGEEVIAVPDFYIGEDGVNFLGSRGNEYTLFNETLHIGFLTEVK